MATPVWAPPKGVITDKRGLAWTWMQEPEMRQRRRGYYAQGNATMIRLFEMDRHANVLGVCVRIDICDLEQVLALLRIVSLPDDSLRRAVALSEANTRFNAPPYVGSEGEHE
jgi:hypothetical protein